MQWRLKTLEIKSYPIGTYVVQVYKMCLGLVTSLPQQIC